MDGSMPCRRPVGTLRVRLRPTFRARSTNSATEHDAIPIRWDRSSTIVASSPSLRPECRPKLLLSARCSEIDSVEGGDGEAIADAPGEFHTEEAHRGFGLGPTGVPTLASATCVVA